MYYVNSVTRGPGMRPGGTPAQAFAWLAQGGKETVTGFGALTGVTDHSELAATFEHACWSCHDPRATIGYRSITFTLPKEASLFADPHGQVASELLLSAAAATLNSIYGDKHYCGVGVARTRYGTTIHHRVHALVAEFASERATGRVVSINSKRGGGAGPRQLRALKVAWKEAVDRHFLQRLGVRIEQARPFAAPTIVTPDGQRLPPLAERGPSACTT